MMPKGVEHFKTGNGNETLSMVRIPMMPKGVEHPAPNRLCQSQFAVRIPMMPKGVEHTGKPPQEVKDAL